jgi:hypothetical protein
MEQVTTPLLQGLPSGTQLALGVHGAQVPLLQYKFVPHGAPLVTLPAALHTGAPELQSMVIFWHEPLGVQSAPVEQALHVPLLHTAPVEQALHVPLLHTPLFMLHGVPSVTSPSCMHVDLPEPSQTVAPF